jgi:hypothetical protein
MKAFMMTFVSILFASASALAQPQVLTPEAGLGFESYLIVEAGVSEVQVTLSIDYTTRDSCNRFSLSGDLAAVKSFSAYETFIADFGIMGTEIGCPPSTVSRTIPLKSQSFSFKPNRNGEILVRLIVPQGYRVEANTIK